MNLIDTTSGEYPRSMWQLRRDYPNVSFPAEPTDADLAPFGHALVRVTPQPSHHPRNERVQEVAPVLADGVWRQQWQVVAATAEEVAAWDAANAPPPDWARFKATLMADTAVNSALGAALPMVPSAVLALPAALMSVSQGGDPGDFYGAWNAIRGAGLVSADLLASIGALAVSCNLPPDFTTEILRPFASAVGQSWTGPDGRRWEVVQTRDSQGQFLADNPATPERESLSWQVIP